AVRRADGEDRANACRGVSAGICPVVRRGRNDGHAALDQPTHRAIQHVVTRCGERQVGDCRTLRIGGDPVEAGDDARNRPGRAAVECSNRYQAYALRDTGRASAYRCRDVRAVTVAVGPVFTVRVEAERRATAELAVGVSDAGVHDVHRDALASSTVIVRPVEGTRSLVDAVKAPGYRLVPHLGVALYGHDA